MGAGSLPVLVRFETALRAQARLAQLEEQLLHTQQVWGFKSLGGYVASAEHDLTKRLLAAAALLRDIAVEYHDLTLTPDQEAMTWPLAMLTNEEGNLQLWCGKDDCPLDGHNSLILDLETGNITVVYLMALVMDHIARSKDRMEDL